MGGLVAEKGRFWCAKKVRLVITTKRTHKLIRKKTGRVYLKNASLLIVKG